MDYIAEKLIKIRPAAYSACVRLKKTVDAKSPMPIFVSYIFLHISRNLVLKIRNCYIDYGKYNIKISTFKASDFCFSSS